MERVITDEILEIIKSLTGSVAMLTEQVREDHNKLAELSLDFRLNRTTDGVRIEALESEQAKFLGVLDTLQNTVFELSERMNRKGS